MKLASRPAVGNEQSTESDHYAPLCPWIFHLRHLSPSCAELWGCGVCPHHVSNYGQYRIVAFVNPVGYLLHLPQRGRSTADRLECPQSWIFVLHRGTSEIQRMIIGLAHKLAFFSSLLRLTPISTTKRRERHLMKSELSGIAASVATSTRGSSSTATSEWLAKAPPIKCGGRVQQLHRRASDPTRP